MKNCAAESEHPRQDAAKPRSSRPDALPLRIIVSALVLGILAASTSLYFSGLDRAALLLHN